MIICRFLIKFKISEREDLEKIITLKYKRKKKMEKANELMKKKLIQEQQENKDILFVNVTDVYRNLPRKVLHFCRW